MTDFNTISNNSLTPKEIVFELDKYIVGQQEAKRMVAIAVRNRWRRQQLSENLRDEISPKNIIMVGPTGVGKTEIARRLAKLCASPFIKVEATKYTEVGYVGRDVESMVRDLMEIGVSLVKQEESERVKDKANKNAEERLLDILLPTPLVKSPNSGLDIDPKLQEDKSSESTREKLRAMWLAGRLDSREIEMDIVESPQVETILIPGMEQISSQFKDSLSKMFPQQKKRRKILVKDAFKVLVQEESERLLDSDAIILKAKDRVEQTGIIFIDEIDKIAIPSQGGRSGADISREGVQRDLLPIVEGSVVSTKYGSIKTDHILFIAAGAFHVSKPSDLIPELQGRFPLRVTLSSLGKNEFIKILTEPSNALPLQYKALLETEGLEINFTPEALEEIAFFAESVNKQTENIGARRLYTIMERILSDLSFEASDKNGEKIFIDNQWVKDKLSEFIEDNDLSRFIL